MTRPVRPAEACRQLFSNSDTQTPANLPSSWKVSDSRSLWVVMRNIDRFLDGLLLLLLLMKRSQCQRRDVFPYVPKRCHINDLRVCAIRGVCERDPSAERNCAGCSARAEIEALARTGDAQLFHFLLKCGPFHVHTTPHPLRTS